MLQLRDAFARILRSGGVFVVFADAKTGMDIKLARRVHGYVETSQNIDEDVWYLLPELSDLTVFADQGKEMHPASESSPLVRLLARYLNDGNFTCTLQQGNRYTWKPLAKNKFEEPVALTLMESTVASVIVLPQIRDKAGFITELFTTVLPELAPQLFPYIEQGKWTHLPEYELPRVVELEADKEEILQRAKAELRQIDAKLADVREAEGWIHTLITGTDNELVDAVKTALHVLGFSSVVDVDVERDREGKSRREDLQIKDQSPTIIVDIKGIGGYPSDADALQAGKHAAIRIKEQDRTDIIGLSIVNHQRYLPPLDRENVMPFRQELIDSAEEMTIGLLTSWDLFRLVRNSEKLRWRIEDVKPLFYQRGRIDPIPGHYQFIGTIAKAWTEKFGVHIGEGELRIGDRVAVEFPIEFEESPVDSIHVNDRSVEKSSDR